MKIFFTILIVIYFILSSIFVLAEISRNFEIELMYDNGDLKLKNIYVKISERPIESVGQPFVPHLHQAVDTIYTEEVAENTILEEQRRGYVRGDAILRYAEVVVAKKEGK